MSNFLPTWANVILTFVGLAIAVGNAMVCYAFYLNRKIRTRTNHLVISLAVSDFLVGSILVPIRTWKEDSPALGPLIAFILIGSLTNICGCTYDRYVAIQQPLRYQAILTKKRLYKVLFVIWIVPLIIALIPQIWLQCKEQLGMDLEDINLTNRVYIGGLAFSILGTCLALTGIYISIFRVARRHFAAISYLSNYSQPAQQDDPNSSRIPNRRMRRFSLKSLVKDVKATKLFAMIGATFVLCWFPLIVINVMDSLGYQSKVPPMFANIALFTIFANSLVNPLIYAFFQQSFRDTVASWFRRSTAREERNIATNGDVKAQDTKRPKKQSLLPRRSTYDLPVTFQASSNADQSSYTETKF